MLSKNQIKQIQSLQLKKFRDAEQLFIAEGVKSVSELLDSAPQAIVAVYATHNFIEKHSTLLTQAGVTATEITEAELNKVSLQATPNQVLAVCNYFKAPTETPDFDTQFYLYLDDVRDPGNMGTILRLADWFGISTVFCSPASCDVYNPKVIQSTMGAFLRVRTVYVPLDVLIRTHQVHRVYGAVLNGKMIYREVLQPGLIVIGNEANGIADGNLQLINNPITIPAHGTNGTESLNAAMAASIITSEFFRQLKAGG